MSNAFLALYDFSGGLAFFIGFNLFIVLVLNFLIMLIEAVVLKKMNYGSLFSCFFAAIAMNFTSTFAGYSAAYIAISLSQSNISGTFMGLLAIFPRFVIYPQFQVNTLQVLLFFGVGYLLTVILEMVVLFILRREHSLVKIGKMVLVTNFFSYLFLIIVFGLAKTYFSSLVR